MAINYPGSLDDFTNPAAGNTLDSPSHSGQHSDLNDAVEALEAKVGIGASPAGSATAGQVLTAQGGGTAIWADASGGKVVQIVSATYSTTVSNASVSYVDSGLTATITPTSASNKVLILVAHNSCLKSGHNTSIQLKLLRGATDLRFVKSSYTNDATPQQIPMYVVYLDSPATTSATTYKTQFSNVNSVGSVEMQQGSVGSDIVLLEVEA